MIKRWCLAVLCVSLAAPVLAAEASRPARKDGREVYIVELSAPPLALSKPRGRGERLDPGSRESVGGAGEQASDFYTVTPCRLTDTRESYPVQADQARSFLVSGHCGVPVTAKAVAVNVTVLNGSAASHVVLYPANLSVPNARTVSYTPGITRASNAIVRLSTDGEGRLGAFTAAGQVDVIVDVVGYFE